MEVNTYDDGYSGIDTQYGTAFESPQVDMGTVDSGVFESAGGGFQIKRSGSSPIGQGSVGTNMRETTTAVTLTFFFILLLVGLKKFKPRLPGMSFFAREPVAPGFDLCSETNFDLADLINHENLLFRELDENHINILLKILSQVEANVSQRLRGVTTKAVFPILHAKHALVSGLNVEARTKNFELLKQKDELMKYSLLSEKYAVQVSRLLSTGKFFALWFAEAVVAQLEKVDFDALEGDKKKIKALKTALMKLTPLKEKFEKLGNIYSDFIPTFLDTCVPSDKSSDKIQAFVDKFPSDLNDVVAEIQGISDTLGGLMKDFDKESDAGKLAAIMMLRTSTVVNSFCQTANAIFNSCDNHYKRMDKMWGLCKDYKDEEFPIEDGDKAKTDTDKTGGKGSSSEDNQTPVASGTPITTETSENHQATETSGTPQTVNGDVTGNVDTSSTAQ